MEKEELNFEVDSLTLNRQAFSLRQDAKMIKFVLAVEKIANFVGRKSFNNVLGFILLYPL